MLEKFPINSKMETTKFVIDEGKQNTASISIKLPGIREAIYNYALSAVRIPSTNRSKLIRIIYVESEFVNV